MEPTFGCAGNGITGKVTTLQRRDSGRSSNCKNLNLYLTFCLIQGKIIYVVTQGFTLQAQIAQLVEQRTENPRVTGSIPVLGSISEP